MSQLSVLVVDDNQDLAMILDLVLQDEGYQVTVKYNGADALEAIRAENFDAVFLDVKLPDMNGIEIFWEISQTKPQTRVFVMTGYRCEQLMSEVVDNGTVQVVRTQSEIKHLPGIIDAQKNESIILVLNSTPKVAKGLTEFLADSGCNAYLALNAREAVKEAFSNSVDVLLLDLHKPVVYSLGVYMELKKQGHAVKTVIFAEGLAEIDQVSDVLQSTTITGCLFKPFDPEIIINLLKKEFPSEASQ